MIARRVEPEHVLAVNGQTLARTAGIRSGSVEAAANGSRRSRDLGGEPIVRQHVGIERVGEMHVEGDKGHPRVRRTNTLKSPSAMAGDAACVAEEWTGPSGPLLDWLVRLITSCPFHAADLIVPTTSSWHTSDAMDGNLTGALVNSSS